LTRATGLVAAAVALAVLGACGNDRPGPNPVVAAFGSMAKASVAKIKARKSGGAPAAAPITRADLEKYGKPILRVTSKSLGQDGFLTISDAKAEVVTWATTDRVTFSLRNGVLIQTRGLGADLMSAEAPTIGQLSAPGTTYQRIYFFLGSDDGGTRRTYDCATSVAGRETIEIVGRSHQTTHISEVCSRPGTQIANDYWIEGTAIRKSRQWTSGRIGYVEFERVVD
jgi:Group 4 capsule polysaccharide lipoprotein gfcB, YjbF